MKKRILALILCITLVTAVFTCYGASAAEIGEPEAVGETQPAEEILVPQIRIVTTDNVGLSLKKADDYVEASMTVTGTDGTVLSGAGQVKIRGNSTSALNKKSYTFKYDAKKDVLGMGKAKKWALVANAFDPTLLRNYVAIEAAAQLGLEYTSEHRIVEVWMDGSFRGCYTLIEPIQEGKTRVDIDIESNGGMNDFLIEREYNHVDAGVVYFTSNGVRFACKDPDEPSESQLAYIKATMNEIISTLKTGTREKIKEMVDIPSFARYYLLNEFVKDVDVDYSSVFFYYKSGKLYAGPAWDYDLALGNEDAAASANYARANAVDGLYCNDRHLFRWLCSRDWFFDEVRQVYLEYSDVLDSIGAEGGLIDSLYSTYKTVIDRNFSEAKWRMTYYANLNKRPLSTYQANLDYFKSWCSDRAAWLKGYFTEDLTGYLLGDSDLSGDVGILDATAIQRTLASLSVSAFDTIAADTDGDGTVSILDATIIQRWLAAIATPEPVGKQMYRK